MKKIGILFGQENTFPQAFVDRINDKKVKGIQAEFAHVEEVFQGRGSGYEVLLDRISQDVPFYRAFLKNAALNGTAVMNNPFWWSADEKFFNNALATKIGVPVPKTYLLPSKDMPKDTSGNTFRNLKYPLDWGAMFEDIGFPAYMKPHSGGGWKSVYKTRDIEHLFDSYGETGDLVMLFQEEIVFESYFRCYCLGGKYVRIMQYEPRNPHHLRYVRDGGPVEKALLDKIHGYVLALNAALGYDFNTVEFAVKDGVPYAIDFCNPAPDADLYSIGEDNFEWVVENAANMAIERAQAHQDGKDNLTWGSYIRQSVLGSLVDGSSVADGKSKARKSKSVESNTTAAPIKRGRPRKEVSEEDLNRPKRGRGRPRKERSEEDLNRPKRGRGRPRKERSEEDLNRPKRGRGRPRKERSEEDLNRPKRGRGRPRKPVSPEDLNKPKRPRGRPRKPVSPEDLNKPKLGRGRPRKEVAVASVAPISDNNAKKESMKKVAKKVTSPKAKATAKKEVAKKVAAPKAKATAKKEVAKKVAAPKAKATAKKEEAKKVAAPKAKATAKKEVAKKVAAPKAKATAKKEVAKKVAAPKAKATAKKEVAKKVAAPKAKSAATDKNATAKKSVTKVAKVKNSPAKPKAPKGGTK